MVAIKTADETRGPEPVSAQLIVSLPPSVAAAMDRAMKETGDAPGTLFGKALGLYLLALDARRRDKVVGSADSPESLETEFTGF